MNLNTQNTNFISQNYSLFRVQDSGETSGEIAADAYNTSFNSPVSTRRQVHLFQPPSYSIVICPVNYFHGLCSHVWSKNEHQCMFCLVNRTFDACCNQHSRVYSSQTTTTTIGDNPSIINALRLVSLISEYRQTHVSCSVMRKTEAIAKWIGALRRSVRGSTPSSVIRGQDFCSNLLNGGVSRLNTAVKAINCGQS